MFVAILTLLTALSISAVAIYYSVAGLAAIFAAAVVPIIIMGVVLEVGKLVTAVWLHRNWNNAVWWLKSYLVVALVVLMFITSMGIFGFLSKAHVEQTSMTLDQKASIVSIESKIERSQSKIDRWRIELDRLLKGEDVRVDSLVLREQAELDKLFEKIKIEKNDARADADKQINIQKDRLKQAQERKEADIAAAQERFKNSFSKRKLDEAIADAKSNELAVASAAQKEILKIQELLESKLSAIDAKYVNQIKDIETRIQNLRNQANDKTDDIDAKITQIENQIDAETRVMDSAMEEKAGFEKEYRKLEAEVGPIKYIAEFIYKDKADERLLEEAVRWVIITIIFVFDPLAVLLLIAANMSLVRRLPGPKPSELVDLEKPDPSDLAGPPTDSSSDEKIDAWNKMIDEATKNVQNEKLKKQQEEWDQKLAIFNEKVVKPSDDKPIEFITEEQKKDEKIEPSISEQIEDAMEEELDSKHKEDVRAQKIVDNVPPEIESFAQDIAEKQDAGEIKDGFDPDEVKYDSDTPEKILEDGIPSNGFEQFNDDSDNLENNEPTDQEGEQYRIKPDLTEVIEPQKDVVKNAKPRVLRTTGADKPLTTAKVTFDTDDKLLKEPMIEKPEELELEPTPEQLKEERDLRNKNTFIQASGITEDDARNHPPLTSSRMQFFQDTIDDILRGDQTIETVPEEHIKTLAILMSDFDNPHIIEPKPTTSFGVDKGLENMSPDELANKFESQTEDRDMTDEELDRLLADTEENAPDGKTQIVIQNGKKIRVPMNPDLYVQNEEQGDQTSWNKIKEFDMPEPEKNDLDLPEPAQTPEDEVIDKVDETSEDLEVIEPQHTISADKIAMYRKRLLTDEQYQRKIEARIDDMITKIERGDLKITDLTEADRNVIIRIMKEQKED